MTIWTTKDGRKLWIGDMTTEHLNNCVAHLRKRGFVSEAEFLDALGWGFSMSGEMASYYAEQEVAAMCPNSMIDRMEAELDRRKDLKRRLCA